MAVDPSGSTIPSSEFYSRGYARGSDAASAAQSKQTGLAQGLGSDPLLTDPSYKATAADKASYQSGFNAGYDAVYKSKSTAYGTDYTKTVKADEDRQKGLKTVEQWENEASIPSWGIAQAVAANFNVDVTSFEEKVVSNADAIAKSSYGESFAKRNGTFAAEWARLYMSIQSQSLSSPSVAVAEVRKARAALNALKQDLNKTVASPVVFTPDKKKEIVVSPPPPAPADAKISIPTWGIVAALGALGAGGYFLFFYKKDGEV
jgi:hypothetical protein